MLSERRYLVVLVCIALAAASVPFTGSAEEGAAEEGAAPVAPSDAPPCPATAVVQYIGLACRTPEGLYATFGPSGEFLGYTHGPDPLTPGDPIVVAAPDPPQCVAGTASEYYTQVIYARASNDVDNFAATAPAIRTLVEEGNALVEAAAHATGGHGELKVRCLSGVIEVKNEVLPTPMASATYVSIESDLRAKGYTSIRVKYWVFYDDPGACGCAGIGSFYPDDSLSVNNLNNGAAGTTAMYAINFGYTGAQGIRTYLHELSHTMGAVQNSAPQSTGAGHCWDGSDIMCYTDSAYAASICGASFYCLGTCPGTGFETYDCNRNTYFSRGPAAGTYLATKWNIGSTLNRFLAFQIPVMATTVCPAARGITQSVTCTFSATDDNSVRFLVEWGDATSTCVPSCSTFVASGAVESATKTSYATGGTKTIKVTPIDNSAPAQTGAFLARNVQIDAIPPVTTVALAGTAGADPTWYRTDVTVTLTATDAGGTGVFQKFLKVDGGAFALYTAPVVISTEGVHTIQYYSTDNGDNTETVKSSTVKIDKTVPTVPVWTGTCGTILNLVCSGGVTWTWQASDPGSALDVAVLYWAYIALVTQVTGGVVCQPVVTGLPTYSTSCTFPKWNGLVPGAYCFQLYVRDRAGNEAVGPYSCTNIV